MKKLALIALLALAACAPAADAPKLSGVDLAAIDTSVAPGDDFGAYASGLWEKSAVIPPDRSDVGVWYDVIQIADKRMAELIAAIAAAKPAAGTDEQKIADFYSAFVDRPGIDAKGLAPIKPQLHAIAAIADKASLSKALGLSVRADVDPLNATNYWTKNLFGVFVTQGLEDPSAAVPYLMQGGLGMPDRDYYLSADPDMARIRAAYKPLIADLFRLAGRADAQAAAERVYALETKIARAQAPLAETQDVHKANNPWSRADFDAKAPGLDWQAFFDAAQLGGQQRFIVWHPGATAGLSKLVASEPVEAWRDLLAFHLLTDYAAVLPQAIDDRNFAFYGQVLSGTPQQRARDKRAIRAVNGSLGDAVGKLYVAKYFPPAAKAEVETMVKNIVAAFDARVAALDWMTPATKAEARAKIKTITVGVGYPDVWPRDFSSLEIRPDDAFGNSWRANLFEYRHQLSKIGKATDPKEWWMNVQEVNALNIPLQNALNFPAATLETPFYDPNFDAAANYGSIGATIGHEISHSFDDTGAEFDSQGRLRNWWTPADLARFQAAGAALAKQYDAYEALPGLRLSGSQTLGENIADLAGLGAAYDAYRASLGGKEAPVIDGLTGDQRFFLAYARSWREKLRPEALRSQVATDVHAPGAWRVRTVRNLDAWYAAFGVKPGQKMYLAPKDRVRVW